VSISISDLEPKALWSIFDRVTSIPRPSGHEQKIAKFIMDFAKAHQKSCTMDETGNVIIEVESNNGKNAPLVILQGHMDMVPVVESGYSHDFLNDPIDTYIDNNKVKAHHTTLGADNGIAIAMMLALISEPSYKHGPLRLIFTVEEETSMKGASLLDKKYLQGDYLINLDSEDNGYVFASCAGSCDINIGFGYDTVKTENTRSLEISLDGFNGGHSGADIHLGRANAIKVLATMLNDLAEDYDFFIESIDGGFVRNSIPTKAKVTLAVDECEFDAFKDAAVKCFNEVYEIFSTTDPKATCTLKDTDTVNSLAYAQTLDLIHLLVALPDGIERMSPVYEGIVETSINLGVVKTLDNAIEISLLPRSLSGRALEKETAKVLALCDLTDSVEVSVSNLHEAWESASHTHLIEVLDKCYKEITGCNFKITALHAGVECAQFAKANKELQLISIGPTIEHPHSIDECLDIEGTNQIFSTVCRALAIL